MEGKKGAKYDGRAEAFVRALCKRRSIPIDVIDWKAQWDSSLTFQENKSEMEKHAEKYKPKTAEEMAAEMGGKKQTADFMKEKEREAFVSSQLQKQAYIQELFTKASVRQGNGEAILKELESFSPWNIRFTLSTLMALNQRMHIINHSPPGIGKTRSTKELLDQLGIPYTEITGHYAPTDFFEKLRDAKGILLVDESATLLKNIEILNLLLSALWSGDIQWRDEKSKIECTIIFNTNSLPKTDFSKALVDRCQYNVLRLPPDKIKDKIESRFVYMPKPEIWDIIKNNAFVQSTLTPKEIELVRNYLHVSTPHSVRDQFRTLAQARFCKSLFGDVGFTRIFVNVDPVAEILGSELPRSEKVKALAETEGVTKRTAQVWMSDFEKHQA